MTLRMDQGTDMEPKQVQDHRLLNFFFEILVGPAPHTKT